MSTPAYVVNPTMGNETKNEDRAHLTNLALTCGMVFFAGTGSALSIENSHKWIKDVQYRFPISIQDNSASTTSQTVSNFKSPVQHLEFIKDTIAPSITELAQLIGVSRQTVHKWLIGGNPDQEHLDRIVAIGAIADQVAQANLSQPQWLVKMKIFDGQSLTDLIHNSQLTAEHVEQLIAEAKKVESDYQNSPIHKSNTTPTDDWKSDASVPYLEE